MTLDGEEFIRRYLQHLLPKGLLRIRHDGFLANRGRQQALLQIRAALQAVTATVVTADASAAAAVPFAGMPCPRCTGGWMVIVAH